VSSPNATSFSRSVVPSKSGSKLRRTPDASRGSQGLAVAKRLECVPACRRFGLAGRRVQKLVALGVLTRSNVDRRPRPKMGSAGAGQVSSEVPCCRINAAFRQFSERCIYAAAKKFVARPWRTVCLGCGGVGVALVAPAQVFPGADRAEIASESMPRASARAIAPIKRNSC
jgi:hypothetical protein